MTHLAAYGFFKPDAIEDNLVNTISEFIELNGYNVLLGKKHRFTKTEILYIYKEEWRKVNTIERKLQLESNLNNLLKGESHIFKIVPFGKFYKTITDLYADLDKLKGKAYDNPAVSIRSIFKTPFVDNMTEEETVYRISRNRIHIPSSLEDVTNLEKMLNRAGLAT